MANRKIQELKRDLKSLSEYEDLESFNFQVERDRILRELRPLLKRQQYGKTLVVQVEKIIAANNFDRACKLLDAIQFGVPKVWIIMFAAFLAAGLGGSWYGGTRLMDALESVDWPSVQGVIVSSEVKQARHCSSSDHGSLNCSYHYIPHVTYSYKVNGVERKSDLFAYKDYSEDAEVDAQHKLADYPPGGQVTVYYKPAAPEVAVIIRGPGFMSYMVPALAALALIAALVMLVKILRLLVS